LAAARKPDSNTSTDSLALRLRARPNFPTPRNLSGDALPDLLGRLALALRVLGQVGLEQLRQLLLLPGGQVDHLLLALGLSVDGLALAVALVLGAGRLALARVG